jgi:hypothetical protein
MSVILNFEKKVSIANFLDKCESENEDFVRIISISHKPYSLYAISDGAGGSGVFSKEWSKYLCENIPLAPSEFGYENTIKWFNNISQGFYNDIILKQDLSDLILKRKVFKEGSFSTLTICWIDKEENELLFSSSGDSCFFYFEKNDDVFILKQISSLNLQAGIDDAPFLLNWNIELEKQLSFDSIEIENEFRLIIASDSLAKWILLNLVIFNVSALEERYFSSDFKYSLNAEKYQSQKSNIRLGSNLGTIESLFYFLKNISQNTDMFKSEMIKLYQNQELEIDDYSLIYIEGNVSK